MCFWSRSCSFRFVFQVGPVGKYHFPGVWCLKKNVLPETNASKKQHVQKHGEAKLVFASFWGHYDLLEFRFRRWVVADFCPKEYGVLFNLFFIVGWGEEGGKKLEYTISSRYAVQKAPHALKEPRPQKKKNTITLLVNTSIKKKHLKYMTHKHQCVIFLSLHIHQGRGFYSSSLAVEVALYSCGFSTINWAPFGSASRRIQP